MQVPSIHTAVVVSAPGQMSLENVSTRQLQAGEMLVSPLYVGICGSDLDILRGTRPVGTWILGHEGVAKIVAIGPGMTTFSVGQYVTFLPNNPNNPEDILGVSSEGLFQQYLLISQAALERGMVVLFDTRIPLVCGPLLEPFATVIYGQRLVEQVCKPKSIVVVGAGPIGLLTALYARERGCAQIFLTDISQTRLDWAVAGGIVQSSYALLNSPQLENILLEQTSGQGVDAAYLCTPRSVTRSVLQQALHFVREEGCIDLTAGTNSREALPELPGVDLDRIRQANVCGLGHEVKQVVTWDGKRLWLTGQSGASESYLQEAMKLLLKEPTRYASVISHLVTYRAAPQIFEHLLTTDSENIQGAPCVKVVIDFTRDDEEINVFDPQLMKINTTPNC